MVRGFGLKDAHQNCRAKTDFANRQMVSATGRSSRSRGRGAWNREHVKSAVDKAKGAIKDTAGKIAGDTKMQAEGKTDKAKGAARNVAGDVKYAVRDATDND